MTTTASMADTLSLVGFIAFDPEGGEVGEVLGAYPGPERWSALRMDDGTAALVPLVDAQVYEDSLEIPFTTEQVRRAPLRGPEPPDVLSEEGELELLSYYREGIRRPTAQAGAAGQEVASTAKRQARRATATAVDQTHDVASTAKAQTRRVASTVADQGRQVLDSTATQAGDVIGTAKEQAAEVGQQVSTEARNLLEETTARLEEQTAAGAAKLGDNLQRLGQEALALAEGRPDEAPTVQGCVKRVADTLLDAADRAYGVSDDVQSRGMGALLADVQTFARRRPGVFLLGAAAAGLVAGRAVCSAKSQDDTAPDQLPTAGRPAAVRGVR